MLDSLKTDDQRKVITYNQLRAAIGIMGIALPVVLVISNAVVGECDDEIICSISHNYFTAGRDWFVGILSAVAFFLFAYRGYNSNDRVLSRLGALFALGIIAFPTNVASCDSNCLIYSSDPDILNVLHFVSAFLFFVVLIIFCLVQFVKTGGKKKDRTACKKKRNIIYYTCGCVMIICVLVMGVDGLFAGKDGSFFGFPDLFFWAEGVALWAFGISWLTKAEIIFPDQEEEQDKNGASIQVTHVETTETTETRAMKIDITES